MPIREIEITLKPEQAQDRDLWKSAAARKLHLPVSRIKAIEPLRRSIDARKRPPQVLLRLAVYLDQLPVSSPNLTSTLPVLSEAPRVIVVGAGPAGYFAALELLELGIVPLVLDRGKDVRSRRKDLRQIQQFGVVDADSNYCFGEGGAGTYSDGKLYTRSHKRGSIAKILKLLVEHGADPDILVDAHPHIGSNKLPRVVQNIRETLESHGAVVRFQSRVSDLLVEKGRLAGVVVNDAETLHAEAVLLATGHSARDIFELLQRREIRIEAKPFAVGVRVEHPQPLIDRLQYGSPVRPKGLPAAAYRLACQVSERGVYSFCMCPGGWIVPASTAPGELVINGMSLSRRDNEFANSGIVVSVELEDLLPYQEHGPLAGLAFQREIEKMAFLAGGDDTQRAPAQRLSDFVEGRLSATLGPTSYIPGIHSAPLHQLLPAGIAARLREGFREFGKKMKGFYSEEAQILAVESRTSSPVRIPRDAEHLNHPEIANLFPCGEGAGYAGGIVSAALDGQNVARAIGRFFAEDAKKK
ncbi:MAG TPA: FAD-dependent oxidoreductase [Calditrichia bacterium]|nr:FAD-dependent oxidoreductase [Calditrichota bacterium]HQV31337.1 FAD-dependent oxidoreductase [Calditrichia bacterium]